MACWKNSRFSSPGAAVVPLPPLQRQMTPMIREHTEPRLERLSKEHGFF